MRGWWIFFGWIGFSLAGAAPPDYAREDRWADEIVPAIVVGEAIYLATPARSRVLAIYIDVERPKGAVVVVHGLGVHPDWGLIGALRMRLADAGYATLSIQMPVLATEATRADYVVRFPEAGERIAAGVAFLRTEGFEHIAIVAHSLGAAMTNAWLASANAMKIDAWIPIGMPVDFAAAPAEPILDVIAAHDLPEVLAIAPARARELPRDRCSEQVSIVGAEHYFSAYEAALSATIAPFLARALAGSC